MIIKEKNKNFKAPHLYNSIQPNKTYNYYEPTSTTIRGFSGEIKPIYHKKNKINRNSSRNIIREVFKNSEINKQNIINKIKKSFKTIIFFIARFLLNLFEAFAKLLLNVVASIIFMEKTGINHITMFGILMFLFVLSLFFKKNKMIENDDEELHKKNQ